MHRSVVVDHDALLLAADAGVGHVGLEHRARLVVFFIRSSGSKFFPFSMPMDASRPNVSGSMAPLGSSCTT
jgi:hypothetical protein